MPKKVKKISQSKKKFATPAAELIADACRGMVYISETDAPLTPFSIKAIDEDILTCLVRHFELAKQPPIETQLPDDFFRRLIAVNEQQDGERRTRATRWAALQSAMASVADDLLVVRSGEIRIDIYIAGRTAVGEIVGFSTKAVET